MSMTHHDLDLLAEPRRRQVREAGAQPPEAPAVAPARLVAHLPPLACFGISYRFRRPAQPRPRQQLAPLGGDVIDLPAGGEPLQRVAVGGEEDEGGVVRVRRLRPDLQPRFEQAGGPRQQGDDAADAPALAAAEVDGAGVEVDDLYGEVGQVGVVEGPVEAEGDPHFLLAPRRLPEFAELVRGVALGLADPVVAAVLFGGLDEGGAEDVADGIDAVGDGFEVGVVGEVSELHRPAHERLDVGDVDGKAAGRFVGERGGEVGAGAGAELAEGFFRPGRLEESAERALVVPRRHRAHGLGLAGADPLVVEGEEVADHLGEGGAAGGLGVFGAGLNVGVDLRPLGVPLALDLVQGGAFAADEPGRPLVPDAPAVAVRGEVGERLVQTLRDLYAVEPVGGVVPHAVLPQWNPQCAGGIMGDFGGLWDIAGNPKTAFLNGQSRNRTGDTWIFSPCLVAGFSIEISPNLKSHNARPQCADAVVALPLPSPSPAGTGVARG